MHSLSNPYVIYPIVIFDKFNILITWNMTDKSYALCVSYPTYLQI